jgi:hypothetical protein
MVSLLMLAVLPASPGEEPIADRARAMPPLDLASGSPAPRDASDLAGEFPEGKGEQGSEFISLRGEAVVGDAAMTGTMPPAAIGHPLPAPKGDAIALEYAEPWTWQCLPSGLIYHSYLAGAREPRFASQWVYDRTQGALWDVTLGGRVGIFRYGTEDRLGPEGFQLDMEGAAFPRLDMGQSEDLKAVDFRFGIPLTYGIGPYQTKLAYYHICSHLGDEFMLKNPDVERINYVRNGFTWGNSYFWTPNVRLYAEAAWCYDTDGGAKPWEFQFGAEYSPARPTGKRPVPFVAVNGHLREELNYSGNLVVQTGYQWRGETNHLFRAGLHYYTGKSDQYEFFRQYEDKVGLGLWYDF